MPGNENFLSKNKFIFLQFAKYATCNNQKDSVLSNFLYQRHANQWPNNPNALGGVKMIKNRISNWSYLSISN